MTKEQAILNFMDELKSFQLHGFILTLGEQTLAEGYWAPFNSSMPHRLYSVSKSVTALGIGLLLKDGRLKLDDPVADYFPEWVDTQTHPFIRQCTIRHLLTMRTCFNRSMYQPLADSDWTKPFFYGEPTHAPGTLFSYDTSASQVLCALIQRVSGTDALSFMQERLFTPLGMRDPKRWLTDAAGVCQGGTGLIMTLRDFARLTRFCMSDGQGLIDTDYLREATSHLVDSTERSGPEERFGYGYYFWQTRHGFSMYGMGGQMAICVPEKQLALCTTADLILDQVGVQPIYDAFFRHLAEVDTLPSDPEDAQRLRRVLEGLRLKPIVAGAESKTVFLPELRGSTRFSRLLIAPESIEMTIDGEAHCLPYQSGGWASASFPNSSEACLVTGGWTQPDRFELRCELCGDFSCTMKLFVQLNGSAASVRTVSSFNEFQTGWTGDAWGSVAD